MDWLFNSHNFEKGNKIKNLILQNVILLIIKQYLWRIKGKGKSLFINH